MYQSYSKLLRTSWRRYLYKSIHLHQDRADIVVTNFCMHQCPNSKNIYIQKYIHTNICMHCTITFGGRVLENNLSNEDKIQNLTMLCHWNDFCVTDPIITHGYLSASNGKDTGEKYFILDMNKNFCEANSFLEVLWNVKGFCLVVKENFLLYFNFVDCAISLTLALPTRISIEAQYVARGNKCLVATPWGVIGGPNGGSFKTEYISFKFYQSSFIYSRLMSYNTPFDRKFMKTLHEVTN